MDSRFPAADIRAPERSSFDDGTREPPIKAGSRHRMTSSELRSKMAQQKSRCETLQESTPDPAVADVLQTQRPEAAALGAVRIDEDVDLHRTKAGSRHRMTSSELQE